MLNLYGVHVMKTHSIKEALFEAGEMYHALIRSRSYVEAQKYKDFILYWYWYRNTDITFLVNKLVLPEKGYIANEKTYS